jgi:hypothetical protein
MQTKNPLHNEEDFLCFVLIVSINVRRDTRHQHVIV